MLHTSLRCAVLGIAALPLLAVIGCGNTSTPATASNTVDNTERAVPANMAIPGVNRANTAVSSLRNLRDALVAQKTNTDRAIAAMNEVLNGQGDLVPALKNYTATLVDLRSGHQRMKQRIDEMRSGAMNYISGWEVEALGVEDPELRKQAENRRNQVRANYTRINETLKSAGAAYTTFEADASGVQTALANDLTKAGVAAVSTTARKTSDAATAHKQQLDAATAELDRVMGEMTPTGPAAAPTASR